MKRRRRSTSRGVPFSLPYVVGYKGRSFDKSVRRFLVIFSLFWLLYRDKSLSIKGITNLKTRCIRPYFLAFLSALSLLKCFAREGTSRAKHFSRDEAHHGKRFVLSTALQRRPGREKRWGYTGITPRLYRTCSARKVKKDKSTYPYKCLVSVYPSLRRKAL